MANSVARTMWFSTSGDPSVSAEHWINNSQASRTGARGTMVSESEPAQTGVQTGKAGQFVVTCATDRYRDWGDHRACVGVLRIFCLCTGLCARVSLYDLSVRVASGRHSVCFCRTGSGVSGTTRRHLVLYRNRSAVRTIHTLDNCPVPYGAFDRGNIFLAELRG